jgi:hypothetical protein
MRWADRLARLLAQRSLRRSADPAGRFEAVIARRHVVY